MISSNESGATNWGVLITGRLKSTRLPKKVLRPLHGRPMIGHLIHRMNAVAGLDNVVVITSSLPQDDELEAYCKNEGTRCFRGHPEDVMVRMRDACKYLGWDHFISCTADNPFVDAGYAKELMRFHLSGGFDMSQIEGLPFGVFCYAVSSQGLDLAISEKLETDTEVWGAYFSDSPCLSVGTMQIDMPSHRRPEIRLTVDEEADFKLIEKILEVTENPNPGLTEIIEAIDMFPELLQINAKVVQRAGKVPRFK